MSKPMGLAIFMEKATRALSGARLLLASGDTEGACSRAYYAMFGAARAAVLEAHADSLEAATKTHAGLISAFGRYLVQSGQVDAELGRSLNRMQQLRMTADYLGDAPPLEDATWAIEQAEAFVATIAARFA